MNPPPESVHIDRPSLEPGQVVRVRGRRGVIDEEPKWDPESGVHLVRVRYLDEDEPEEEVCLWEREPLADIISGTGYPNVDGSSPTDLRLYQAYLNAVRWSTSLAYPTPGQIFLAGPLRSSILIHNYQLYPLYKAMLMPSVRLFIADDVGLGKTIEAGLVLSELVAQRNIRRVMVVCPASLQMQWKDELEEKFHLDFTIVDRDEVHNVKQRDPNASPWMFHQRIITSMDFLKRAEVLDEFKAATRKLAPKESGRFPWDLIIVDEVHHFAPQPAGEDTERIKMLDDILKLFEHRVFLSATPHNGYPTSFTGLLSLLDPVRFRKTTQIDPETRAELRSIFIRRLKEDVNAEDPPPKFKIRAPPEALPSDPTPEEDELIRALRAYDRAVRDLPGLSNQERSALRFVRTIFTKRLLSSPYALARTWWSHRQAHEGTVGQARLTVDEAIKQTHYYERARAQTTADDTVADDIDRGASRVGASVLQEHWNDLADAAKRVDAALEAMGLPQEVVEEKVEAVEVPVPDSKWEAVAQRIAAEDGWTPADGADAERVIIFTEYRDTQEYLLARLSELGVPEEAILTFYGGAPLDQRELVKDAFNDPDHPVRILVATDAASEGLNLQETCRFVVHHDLPWNPMKIDQRVGRVDRHGQVRKVRTWHHVLKAVEEFEFLARIAEKAEQARADLGRLAPVIEQGIEGALVGDADVDLGDQVDSVETVLGSRSQVDEVEEDRDDRRDAYETARGALDRAEDTMGVDPGQMALVLGQALRLDGGRLEEVEDSLYLWEAAEAWEPHVKDLRRADKARKKLAFDAEALIEEQDGMRVLSKRKDVAVVGMGHPAMERAVRRLRRFVWDPGQGQAGRSVTKWTQDVPADEADTAVLTFMTMARNELGEVLRERVDEVAVRRTADGFEVLPDVPSQRADDAPSASPPPWHAELEDYADDRTEALSDEVGAELTEALEEHMEEARENYEAWLEQSLEALEEAAREGARKEIDRLDREIKDLEEEAAQTRLDPVLTAKNKWDLEQRKKEKKELESLVTTEQRLKEQREHITWEARKYLDEVFPRRYQVGHVETLVVGVRFTAEEAP